MGIKKELGLKIKRMRLSRGLTQEKLAEMVDVSQRTLSGIELGENFCTAETLDKIISALETTPEELFALNHIKTEVQLKEELLGIVSELKASQLEIAYKIIKSIVKE